MRRLLPEGSFKRDWKKVRHSGKCTAEELQSVINLLCADSPLPERLRDHALSGAWKKIQARECHVKPDILLVYSKPENALRLLRIGSHSELF